MHAWNKLVVFMVATRNKIENLLWNTRRPAGVLIGNRVVSDAITKMCLYPEKTICDRKIGIEYNGNNENIANIVEKIFPRL